MNHYDPIIPPTTYQNINRLILEVYNNSRFKANRTPLQSLYYLWDEFMITRSTELWVKIITLTAIHYLMLSEGVVLNLQQEEEYDMWTELNEAYQAYNQQPDCLNGLLSAQLEELKAKMQVLREQYNLP